MTGAPRPGMLPGLRPVGAVAMPGLKMTPVAGEPPHFVLVAPESLLVDESYQRDVSEKSMRLIRRIVAQWDWAVFKPPVVVEVENAPDGAQDGAGGSAMHVIDGQHTAIAAASHPAIATIPVQLVVADRVEDRARAFVRIQRDRIGMTRAQVHRAMLAAGDEDALTLEQVCNRAGIRVLPWPPTHGVFRPGDLIGIGSVALLIRRRHAAGARRVLEICVKAGMAPVSAGAIKAVEWVLFESGAAAEPGPGAAAIDHALTALLADPAGAVEQKARDRAYAGGLPLWRALGEVLRDAVTAGRRAA